MEADQAEEGAWEIEFSRNGIKPRKTECNLSEFMQEQELYWI